jgi:hypothetical protein
MMALLNLSSSPYRSSWRFCAPGMRPVPDCTLAYARAGKKNGQDLRHPQAQHDHVCVSTHKGGLDIAVATGPTRAGMPAFITSLCVDRPIRVTALRRLKLARGSLSIHDTSFCRIVPHMLRNYAGVPSRIAVFNSASAAAPLGNTGSYPWGVAPLPDRDLYPARDAKLRLAR